MYGLFLRERRLVRRGAMVNRWNIIFAERLFGNNVKKMEVAAIAVKVPGLYTLVVLHLRARSFTKYLA